MTPDVPDQAGQEPQLAARVRRGAAWGAVNIAGSRLLQFVSTIIVARILAPEDFGALAVAIVVQTVAMNAAELGATAAIARGDRDASEVAPTVYTIALITSGVLTVVVLASAPWLAALLGNPGATHVIRVMSVTVALSGLSSVPAALLWRDYHQGRRAIVDAANGITALLLVVPLALIGWGAMALAWSRVGGQVVGTVGYMLASPAKFRPAFDRAVARFVLKLGMPLAMANLVVFATLNIDYVVVGRELGPETLGMYLMAFNLAAIPSTLISAAIRTVAIPTFGRMFAAGLLGEVAIRTLALVSYVAFLVSALLAGLGHPLIVILYGDRWAPAAAAMAGLGIFGAGRILSEVFADLTVGAGRTVGLFWVQVLWFVLLVPATLVGVRWAGIAGAAWAHSAVVWIAVVPAYALVLGRSADVRARAVATAILPGLTAGLAAGVVAWWVAGQVTGSVAGLVVGGLAGVASYCLVSAPWLPYIYREFREVVPSKRAGVPAPTDLTARHRLTPERTS